MTVRVERQGAVTTVVLDRAAVRNAVDQPTAEALVAAFEADPEARVAVRLKILERRRLAAAAAAPTAG